MKPGTPEWLERVKMKLAEESLTPLRWHYASFAGAEDGFRGGLFLLAHGPTDFLLRSYQLGLNPGGEMRCLDISDELAADNKPLLPERKYRFRLLNLQELKEACGEIVNFDGEPA